MGLTRSTGEEGKVKQQKPQDWRKNYVPGMSAAEAVRRSREEEKDKPKKKGKFSKKDHGDGTD